MDGLKTLVRFLWGEGGQAGRVVDDVEGGGRVVVPSSSILAVEGRVLAERVRLRASGTA